MLLRMPVTANQVTAASLAAGLGTCLFLLAGSYAWDLAAAVLLVLCYVLDNSDGEVARLKGQCSEFGKHFDTFVDWVVHSGFFLALGWGVASAWGAEIWLWLGAAGGLGSTLNYGLALWRDRPGRSPEDPEDAVSQVDHPGADDWKEYLLFFFRELSRADFCFIVLGLAILDGLWILLPLGAVGAQVYWLTAFVAAARKFHV